MSNTLDGKSVAKFFNRPRPCPGCDEPAYPADPDTVCKRMHVSSTPRLAYFCSQECYDRFIAERDGEDVEPLYGDMLADGADMMSDEELERI